MPIAVKCSRCHGLFSAPDKALGQTTSCPKCGQPITVQPPNEFETAPVIHVSQADIEQATIGNQARSKMPVIGISLVAVIAVIATAIGYSMRKPEQSLQPVVSAGDDSPKDIIDANSATVNDDQRAGLGLSLEQFKEGTPVGKYWKVLTEKTRDNGTVSYQLLGTDMPDVWLHVSGKPDNLSEVCVTFFVGKRHSKDDIRTRLLLMASILSKYSDWTEEEISQWWGRLIQRNFSGGEEFSIQKNGQELYMWPMGIKDGTMFNMSVIAAPKSTAPTLQEWLASHPMAPPTSGKSNYDSIETAGKVTNAKLSFKNFRHKGGGDFIGEMVNDSGRSYQTVAFRLSIYDASGALIDTGTVLISNFKQNETRSFNAYIKGVPGYFSYKIDLENGL